MSETAGPFEVERPPAKFRSGDADHWVLSLHKRGQAVVEADDRLIEEVPGTFSLRALTRPFRGKVSLPSQVLSLHIPRELFPTIAAPLDNLSNSLLEGGLRSILADYLLSLEHRLSTVSEVERPRLVELTKMMIAGCLAPSPDGLIGASEGIAATHVERAMRHISRNLRSPTLSPSELCKVLEISRAQLYRLFEPHGGVAQIIRKQRLEAIHGVLANPNERRRIYEIAYEFGFETPDSFTSAFRREFGYNPSDVRRGLFSIKHT